MEQPVKPNAGSYKVQPRRIENYTPGKSSISDKEAKQVNEKLHSLTFISCLIIGFPFPIRQSSLFCTFSLLVKFQNQNIYNLWNIN